MKLQKTGRGQYFITLPKNLVEAKGWLKGQRLKPQINEKGNIELVSIETFKESTWEHT